jgi:hypothetical protein
MCKIFRVVTLGNPLKTERYCWFEYCASLTSLWSVVQWDCCLSAEFAASTALAVLLVLPGTGSRPGPDTSGWHLAETVTAASTVEYSSGPASAKQVHHECYSFEVLTLSESKLLMALTVCMVNACKGLCASDKISMSRLYLKTSLSKLVMLLWSK